MTIRTRLAKLEGAVPKEADDIVVVGTQAEARQIEAECEKAGRPKPMCIITGVMRPASWSSWRKLIPEIAERGQSILDGEARRDPNEPHTLDHPPGPREQEP